MSAALIILQMRRLYRTVQRIARHNRNTRRNSSWELESAPKKNGFAMDYRRLGRVANGCYQEILHMLCVKPSC